MSGINDMSSARRPAATTYDLCLAWNWEYDADFVTLLRSACQDHSLSLLEVTPCNLATVLSALTSGEIAFRTFLDRATDADDSFVPLVHWARQHAVKPLNPHDMARRAWNKVAMHLELLHAGLEVPFTIVLPPLIEYPNLPNLELNKLGEAFSIKPAHGGGGEGVVNAASSWAEVASARQRHPDQCYLLQCNVAPVNLESRPAWFRVIQCLDQVHEFWWDVETHVYTPITSDEQSRYALHPLAEIVQRIATITSLSLFSTEIALTAPNRFVVVDYVNDPIDLRLRSRAVDGVPDEAVHGIARRIAWWAKQHQPPQDGQKTDASGCSSD